MLCVKIECFELQFDFFKEIICWTLENLLVNRNIKKNKS